MQPPRGKIQSKLRSAELQSASQFLSIQSGFPGCIYQDPRHRAAKAPACWRFKSTWQCRNAQKL